MSHVTRSGVTLDQCPACQGTWFDVGEIARVHGLRPPLGVARYMVDEDGNFPEDPPACPNLHDIALRFNAPIV
jgi:hypothetical protein